MTLDHDPSAGTSSESCSTCDVAQTEEQFRNITENISDWIWEVDCDIRYVYVSPRVVDLLGYPPEEVLGRTPFDFMPPAEASRLRSEIEALMRDPRPFHALENLNLHKDGSARILETSGVPLFDAGGRCTGFRGIDRDVTERKKVEQALKEALSRSVREKARSEAIIAAIGEGLVIVDRDFRILYQNQLLRDLGGEGHKRHCYTIYDGRESVCDECPVAMTFADGQIHTVEKTVTKDGATVYREITASPLFDEGGSIVAGIELVRDITERKLSEERIGKLNADLSARARELEAANKDLEAFSYTVSHDLRGPLTNINSYCQAIEELNGDKLDVQCAGFLHSVFDEVRNMDALITSLLNLSRFSHVKLKNRRVQLTEMAKAIAAELQLRHPRRQASFEIEEGVVAQGDEKLLGMVMANLIGNAWKFSAHQEKTVIRFGTLTRHGTTEYYVSDNGIGFEMSQRGRMFDVFQRLHRGDDFEGFGIGLTTVQRIIERHRGRIWAEGAPGKGARFSFTLHDKHSGG